MELAYRPVMLSGLALFRVMRWRIDIHGAQHLPASGPAVIAANHIGYLDFALISYGARQRGRLVRYMAKEEVFRHPVAGPLMRGMRHIPVDRFGRSTEALDRSVALLRRGELVGMFPEGTVNPSFVPTEGKSGAARMALSAGAPLIPCGLWGSQRLMTKGRPRNWQRGVALTAVFGPPLAYAPDEEPAAVTKRLMGRIGELVERAATTYPQRPAGEDDRWWLPAHLGGSAPTVAEAERIAVEERTRRRAFRRTRRRR